MALEFVVLAFAPLIYWGICTNVNFLHLVSRYDLSGEQISQFRETGMTWTSIADCLRISTATLYRRRRQLGIVENFHPIPDNQLDAIIREIITNTPNAGARLVQGKTEYIIQIGLITFERFNVWNTYHRQGHWMVCMAPLLFNMLCFHNPTINIHLKIGLYIELD